MIAPRQTCMSLQPDSWLTNVCGFTISRLHIEPTARDDDWRNRAANLLPGTGEFTYAKVRADESVLLGQLTKIGYRVVDVNVVLVRSVGGALDCTREGLPNHDIVVGPVKSPEREHVLSIASSCFQFSRFHLDPQFPLESANRIKSAWVESYLDGCRGDELLVARCRGEVAGFLAALVVEEARDRIAVIDLMGVAGSWQRCGIGRALVQEFVDRYIGSCREMRVGTQIANVPSLRLYEACGFRIHSASYILHAHGSSWKK